MINGYPIFRPRPPWLGGDLQTLRNYLTGAYKRIDFPSEQLIRLPTGDGSGDVLVGALHRPKAAGSAQPPLAVLIHGLTGDFNSPYVRATASHLLGLGYPVFRLNLRGAGPSRPHCRQHYHAGRSRDLADAFATLVRIAGFDDIIGIGFSLGANTLLKYLAEQGEGGPVRAAASVSAPIDLRAASIHIQKARNRPYQTYLLAAMKEEALAPGPELSAAERRMVLSARSIWEYDERHIAPKNGFAGAEDYYASCSSIAVLDSIRVPTLIIHADDDPWIPSRSYRSVDWRSNPNLVPLLSRGGGHVGFHALGDIVTWHDRCIERFLAELTATRAVESRSGEAAWPRRPRHR